MWASYASVYERVYFLKNAVAQGKSHSRPVSVVAVAQLLKLSPSESHILEDDVEVNLKPLAGDEDHGGGSTLEASWRVARQGRRGARGDQGTE